MPTLFRGVVPRRALLASLLILFVDGTGCVGGQASEQSKVGTPGPAKGPGLADASVPDHPPDGGEPTVPEPMNPLQGTVFVYVGSASGSITRYRLDGATGALSDAKAVTPGGNPSFLALHPSGRWLYAVLENASRVAAFSIRPEDGVLTEIGTRVSSAGEGPAHLSVDKSGKWVLVSNYGSGHVGTLPIAPDGTLGPAVDVERAGANAHFIDTDPANAFVFVPCKGSDHIASYALDVATGALTASGANVSTAVGAGPRHLAFHPAKAFAYGINELGNTIDVYGYEASSGRLTSLQTVPTLPAGFSGTNTTAEIVVHPSGRLVLGSNRGHNSLAVYTVNLDSGRLSLVGHTSTEGSTPRSFGLTPDGARVLVANADSNEVRAFALDAGSGGLTSLGKVADVASPQFVGAFFIPKP